MSGQKLQARFHHQRQIRKNKSEIPTESKTNLCRDGCQLSAPQTTRPTNERLCAPSGLRINDRSCCINERESGFLQLSYLAAGYRTSVAKSSAYTLSGK